MTHPEVRDNVERERYELVIDGAVVGFAEYRVEGNVVELPHTVIDPFQRGQGLGAILVGGVLDALTAAGRTVIPTCWYVARYIEEHPDRRAALASP